MTREGTKSISLTGKTGKQQDEESRESHWSRPTRYSLLPSRSAKPCYSLLFPFPIGLALFSKGARPFDQIL